MTRLLRFLLAIAGGVMLSLAWLGFPGWLLFVAFLPLLLIDDYFVSFPSRFKSISFWGYSLLTFLIWNTMTTWWIIHATAVGAFLAIIANSLLMSLVFLLAHVIRRHSRATTGYLAYIVLWLSFELAHFHWDIEWPWLTLGNGFANNVRMVQWYSVTGTLGGSLWIWLVNILLFRFLKMLAAKADTRQILKSGTWIGVVVLLPVICSFFQYYNYREKVNPRKVLVIQPNIDPYTETFDEGALNNKLSKFISLTESNLQPGINYIVGPETVFEQEWNETNIMNYQAVIQLQKLTVKEGNSALIIGASTFRVYENESQVTPTARRSRDGIYYDVFNTAIFMDSDGKCQTYHKSILVPGVEKMPFRKYLKVFGSFIINLGGTTGSLGVQSEPENFIAPNGDKIAPAICYESVFGGYLAEFVRKGAHAIFIITNDGWWKNTPGYRQHFSFARLRAVETRRSIVRSANTGISGIINQRGDIIGHTNWWVDAALEGDINFNDKITFYVKYGDYIGRISVMVSILLILVVFTERLVKGKKKPHQS